MESIKARIYKTSFWVSFYLGMLCILSFFAICIGVRIYTNVDHWVFDVLLISMVVSMILWIPFIPVAFVEIFLPYHKERIVNGSQYRFMEERKKQTKLPLYYKILYGICATVGVGTFVGLLVFSVFIIRSVFDHGNWSETTDTLAVICLITALINNTVGISLMYKENDFRVYPVEKIYNTNY